MGLKDKASKLRDKVEQPTPVKTEETKQTPVETEKQLQEKVFLDIMPEYGKLTFLEAFKKLDYPKDEIKRVAKLLDKKKLIKIKKHITGSTEYWVTKTLYNQRNAKTEKIVKKEPAPVKTEDTKRPKIKPKTEDPNKVKLRQIVPTDGSIKLKDACTQLGITHKLGKKLAKKLFIQRYIKVKLHALSDRELSASKKLITLRADKKAFESTKDEERKSYKSIGVQMIDTFLDDIVRIVKIKETTTTDHVAEILNVDVDTVVNYANIMPNIILVEYPANILASPRLKILKEIKSSKMEYPDGKKLDSYSITADDVPADINILDTEDDPMPRYIIRMPIPGPGTKDSINFLSEKLTDIITIDAEEITDPKKMIRLKKKFQKLSAKLVDKYIPASADDKKILTGMLLHKTYGLGNVEIILNDDWLEEVCVNTSHTPLTTYHKKFGWSKTNMYLEDEKMVYNYASQIGRKIGRSISNLDPIMDAHLMTGDRVNATLFPISSLGNTITIRKFARQPWTITHFISQEYSTLSKEMAAFLWLCFQYELNVIVSGGTASGKTSVLNCLLSMIQPTQRIITIEDTREINLPQYLYWNWIPLTTRDPNSEGKGEVSMLDLIVTSLRMRPDRVVLGEIRRKAEAEVLFEAMHTGHAVYATMHADTSRNLKRRLLEPPIGLPAAEVEALHLIIIQYRDRTTGKRKTFEIAEIIPGSESREFDLNYLYRWNARAKEFTKINESSRIFTELNLHTGMDKYEIEKNLKEKEEVLQWMVDKKIETIDAVGKVMENYYKDSKKLLEIVRANKELE